MPPAAGIAMAVWLVLCYFPTYFSPRYGVIRSGGLWVLFALLSFAPVALFLVYALALAKRKPGLLLVPWGLHALFTMPFPLAPLLIWQYYHVAQSISAVPLWVCTGTACLLSAGAMLCYCLAVTGRLKKKTLPLLLTVALPVWSLAIRMPETLGQLRDLLHPPALSFLPYRSPAIISIGLPIAFDILGALPYILLVAGLKAAPASTTYEKGESA
ncbi:MAG: hypothetical protein FWC27_02995 [Firmicutes bacterium]|nr:hypothetical protein [Bacillota bacterium]